ncbi:MAG: hypothetical protein JXA20_06420, partial [Spirochaetes bacterium]|nr:hypothetical protein [Spirochaetota bacterium]
MVRRSIFRHLLSWATFLEAIILIPLCSIMTVHADPKFRSFTDDRHRLEYYVDQGKDAAGAS